MFSSFNKDIFREIRNTFGRFVAIFAIVALGVSFYTGIGSTGVDMKISGEEYFDSQNLMDIRVVSTYGINDNDLSAIYGVDGVESVYPSYSADAFAEYNDVQVIVKAHSVALGMNNVNIPDLVSGRMPMEENEAVAEPDFSTWLGLSVGDYFTLSSGKKTDLRDSLKNVRYKLVGLVNSPYYVSSAERGSSPLGGGVVDFFMYIPESNFRQNVYGEAFITLKDARSMRGYESEYADYAKSVVDKLEDIGEIRAGERYIEAMEGPYSALDAAERELLTSMAAAGDEFVGLYADIAAARSALEAARRDLIIEHGGLYGGLRELDLARESIREGIVALDEADALALSQERELAEASSALAEAVAALDTEYNALVERELLLRSLYADDPLSLAGSLQGIAEARESIAEARDATQGDLESAAAGGSAARAARDGIAGNRESLLAQYSELNGRAGAVGDAEIEIATGYITLERSFNDLDRQLLALEEQEAASLLGVEIAHAEIINARDALDDMDKPKWYVMDRDSNPGYSGFLDDAEKIEAIGSVFPMIFFVVAALVSLTTMTRLVEERRIEIGTLKSLGYGDFKIMSKYVVYAVIPTILGGLLGGLFGMSFFPVTIISAYKSLYTLPYAITIMNARYLSIGVTFGALSTLSATVAACMSELRSSPAVLMRPKAPKKGARIFLESVPFLWNSLKFIRKVTIRNIVRYKKRLFMTVTGVAGCTALLMTGFGLRNSIESMLYLQYGDVNRYDMTVSFTDEAKLSAVDAVDALLTDSPIVRSNLRIHHKNYDAGSLTGGRAAVTVNLVVPEDAAAFNDYTVLRDRLTHEKTVFSENGVIISEQLSSHLAVKPGDSFYLDDDDGERIELDVTGVAECYYQHYVYMPRELYVKAFGGEPEFNAQYVLLGGHTEEQKQLLANDLLEEKGVAAVLLTSTVFNIFNRVVESLNFVVFVLIASAAALAIVVLINLTSINISERKRELATIEVLGFYDREVLSYVYRENFVLTFIGVIAGLALGVMMHAYVIVTAETDTMMFGRQIYRSSFVYSALLTFLFASFVNVITSRRLKRINMVEALKSVE